MIQTFWHWMLVGEKGRRAGIFLILSPWILLDAALSVFLMNYLDLDAFSFAAKTLFPAASILVSMAIAWTARAATVLNDAEFKNKIISEKRPLEDYIYGYQLSLLVLMITVVYVALMAAGGLSIPVISNNWTTACSEFGLYFLLSISIRECWSVINFSNLLGSGLINHNQKMTVAAIAMADMNVWAQRS